MKDRKFNRYAASIPALAAYRQAGIATEIPPHFRKTRHPFLPEARKTRVAWRLAGLRHRRTRRSAGKPPLPRDALIEFELRDGLDQIVGATRSGRLP